MKSEIEQDVEQLAEQGFIDNASVKIHYATLGTGPLMLFVHGFPDYWYTWNEQMLAFSEHFQTVSIDLRGYNLSDKPNGREHYQMRALIADVAATLRHFGKNKATIVGHDWGGAIAWATAMFAPELVERLVILNMLHPGALRRELIGNPLQRKASEYAKNFKREGFHRFVKVDDLVKWVNDPRRKEKYIAAMNRSDIEAMLSYYQNFPDEPFDQEAPAYPKIKCPVLQIFGLNDQHILKEGLAGTCDFVDNIYTLVTIPGAGHFVQQDASEMVTMTILNWLRNEY
jgi:pimeloyl-ACP methyl ester carboxylesterase